MKHIHDSPDELVDRILRGLRAAEPTEGMQRRILLAVEQRTLAPRRWPFATSVSWTIATAALAFASFAFTWIASRPLHRGMAMSGKMTSAISTSLHSTKQPVRESVQQAHPTVLRTNGLQLQRPVAHAKQVATSSEVGPEQPKRSEQDAVALSELHASSHPAPPMPLTRQEQLLLQVIHKGDPVELAMLDPNVRGSEEANSRADFDHFFPPPPLPIIKATEVKNNAKDGESK